LDGSKIGSISGEQASLSSDPAKNNLRTIVCILIEKWVSCSGVKRLKWDAESVVDWIYLCVSRNCLMALSNYLKYLKSCLWTLWSPSITQGCSVIGFILMRKRLTLITHYCPAGYVSPVIRYSPKETKQFGQRLPLILKMFYQSELSIENIFQTFINDSIPLTLEISSINNSSIPDWFYIESKSTLKKKRLYNDGSS
jgi:hypothetical protein